MSRTGGLVAGETRVQVASGDVGILAPAVIPGAIAVVNDATTARRTSRNRLATS
jgi:hypothetical protein